MSSRKVKIVLRKDLPVGVFWMHPDSFNIYISIPYHKSTLPGGEPYHCINTNNETDVRHTYGDSECIILTLKQVQKFTGLNYDWWRKYIKSTIRRKTITTRLP